MINRTYAVAWTPLDWRETQIVRTVVTASNTAGALEHAKREVSARGIDLSNYRPLYVREVPA